MARGKAGLMNEAKPILVGLSLHHTHEILPLGYELATVFLSASPRPLTLATVILEVKLLCVR